MSSNAAACSPRPASFQPQVESLEERCLLDANFLTQPVVPVIDAGMRAYLRDILAYGQQLGNRPNVFAKVGDSNTASSSFLKALGASSYYPNNSLFVGWHTDLAPTIEYFRAQPVDGTGANSFTRTSLAAQGGWGTWSELNPATLPLASELNVIRPAIALIMIGTWDIGFEPNVEAYRGRLNSIVDQTIGQGVIPVLSTLPDMFGPFAHLTERVPTFNQVIVEVAADRHVPLWNYWLAMQALPGKGISGDGIHPTGYPGGSGILTDEALLYGFNQRNLTAVKVLDRIKRDVIDNNPPVAFNQPLTPEVTEFVVGLYSAVLHRVPNMAELEFWGQPVQAGLPRQLAAQAIWQSAEHRGLQVEQYYVAFLKRGSNEQERAFWVAMFQAGANETSIQLGLLTSPEYVAAHFSDDAFVSGLYVDVLGTPSFVEGVWYWGQVLQLGLSRLDVAQAFLTSMERHGQVVDTYYQSYLGRAARPEERQSWVNHLLVGDTAQAAVAIAILASDEFWTHLVLT